MEEMRIKWTIGLLALLSLISISVHADDLYTKPCTPLTAYDQKHCWFVGGGFGISGVEPEPTEDSLWRVEKSSATSFKMFFGLSLSQHFFTEFAYENLGAAELKNLNPNVTPNTDSISYQALSANVGYWLRGRQQAWDVYAKAGLARLITDEQESLAYQDHASQLALGVGAELRFLNQWVGRIEFTSYDKDANSISLTASRHLGPKPKAKPKTKVTFKPRARPRVSFKPKSEEPKAGLAKKVETPKPNVAVIPAKPAFKPVLESKPVALPKKPVALLKPAVTPVPIVKIQPKVAVATAKEETGKIPEKPEVRLLPRASDRDGDGIRNSQDRCPKTPANTEVDIKGCTVLTIITLDMKFAPNRAVIQDKYMKEIDEVAAAIKKLGNVFVTVEAYNDKNDTQMDSQILSELRAAVVADLLIIKTGVRYENFTMRGYSETETGADNTGENQKTKQRIVIIVSQKS